MAYMLPQKVLKIVYLFTTLASILKIKDSYLPHPLNPPSPGRRGGREIKREASPLLDLPKRAVGGNR